MKNHNGTYQISGLFIFTIIIAAFSVTGCATTDDVGRIQYDVNKLRAEVSSIKKKSATIENRLPDQEDLFQKKITALEETQSATARTVSDLLIQLQTLTSEFQTLTGQFEESRYFTEKSSTEVMKSREEQEVKTKELEQAVDDLKKKIEELKILSTKLVQADTDLSMTDETIKKDIAALKAQKTQTVQKQSSQTKSAKTQPSAQNEKIKALYMEGYESFKAGKTVEARAKFSSVLNDYGENDYSDNARFWIAESHYKDGSYEDAILAYEDLFKKNPDSDKVPGAMLKQGLAFYALQDKKTGEIILEKLIAKYPDSEQAKLAMKKMRKTVVPEKSN
ncbi:MAG: tol-pal system protein YbgF [Nitrospiraceae bacterium]|nr:MAG: tol-pal system protein YbgF [Nitrospiraceae bacterium]